MPGVGQAVTVSVVKTVVVSTEPDAGAEHTLPLPVPVFTGGDSKLPPPVITVGVKKQVKHKEPDPVLSLPVAILPLGGTPVVMYVLTTVTVALAE